MLVQCPGCKSLFDLPEASFAASKFRCSHCQYVWKNQHKTVPSRENKPARTFDWILLWSAIGLLMVALYIDYPRVVLFFTDLKADLYRRNADPFVLNQIAESEDDYRPELPTKGEEPVPFDLTNDDDDEE